VVEQILISLGVEDIAAAKAFYADGLGLEVDFDRGYFAQLSRADTETTLGVYEGQPYAYDDGLARTNGARRGLTLSCVVDAPERVDELMARAEKAGAAIVKPAHVAAWGGYIGYFTDPAGNLWKVVVRRDA
jgi:uncharacterized protein